MQSFPFYYRLRKVIGQKPLTKKQYFKIYGFILAWTAAAIYVIGRAALGYDVYLIKNEVAPVLAVTIFCFLWTYFVRRNVNRSNYIYEDDGLDAFDSTNQ